MKWCFRGLLQRFACCVEGCWVHKSHYIYLKGTTSVLFIPSPVWNEPVILLQKLEERFGQGFLLFPLQCFMCYSLSCLCFRHFFQLPTFPSLKHVPGCSASPLGLPSPFLILKMMWVLHPVLSAVRPPFLYLYFSFSLHYVHCYMSPRNHWVLIICVCIKVNV